MDGRSGNPRKVEVALLHERRLIQEVRWAKPTDKEYAIAAMLVCNFWGG
jgi:hypothetical protein